MIFSKIITGAIIGTTAGLLLFTLVPVQGVAAQNEPGSKGTAAVSSGLGLGLEVIGVSKTPAGSFVILQDMKTGKKGVYKAGGVVKGAKIIEVSAEQVVFERNGARETVSLRKSARAKGRAASVPVRAAGEVAGGPGAYPVASDPGDPSLFTFEPVTNETGPVGDGEPPPELPYFEPITNDTGPVGPLPDGVEPKELPEFIPLESLTGPVAD